MGVKFGTVANQGKLRDLVMKNVPFRLQKRLKMRTETYAAARPRVFHFGAQCVLSKGVLCTLPYSCLLLVLWTRISDDKR